VSDRIGSRKRLYMLGFALAALSLPVVVFVTGNALLALIVFQGIVTSLVPPSIFSAAVETAGDERLGGLAMGIIMAGQNAGALAGPLLFSVLVVSGGGCACWARWQAGWRG
jgi:MFS family permease